MDDLFFMHLAYQQASKAYDHDEVPVGAVLVDVDGKIIARAFNQVEKKKMQLAHAEMILLAKACKKMNSWRLSGLTLYVTVQPCMMCLGALYLSRVSRVVFGVESVKFGMSAQANGIYKNLKMKIEHLPHPASQKLLSSFFKQKRKVVYE